MPAIRNPYLDIFVFTEDRMKNFYQNQIVPFVVVSLTAIFILSACIPIKRWV